MPPARRPSTVVPSTTRAGTVSENTGAPFDGTGRVTVSGDRLTYAKPAAPEDPFNAAATLAFTAADLTDSDGVCFDGAALDGCDPSSYGGLLWCLGLFDRPFEPERPVMPVSTAMISGTTR